MALQYQFQDTNMSDESRTMSPASFTLPIRTTISRRPTDAPSDRSDGIQTHLLNFYRTKSFRLKVWTCEVCQGRATGLFHCSISKLYPSTSRIYDVVIPVCISAQCNKRGMDLANEFVNSGGLGEETVRCENCEERSRMKLCATCRFGLTLRRENVAVSRPARSRQRGNRIPASARLEG